MKCRFCGTEYEDEPDNCLDKYDKALAEAEAEIKRLRAMKCPACGTSMMAPGIPDRQRTVSIVDAARGRS